MLGDEGYAPSGYSYAPSLDPVGSLRGWLGSLGPDTKMLVFIGGGAFIGLIGLSILLRGGGRSA